MPPFIATMFFTFGILALFLLDEDRSIRTSWALWLPIGWLLLQGSRPVSHWLQVGPEVSPEQLLEGSPLDRNTAMLFMVAGMVVLLSRLAAVTTILRRNWPILLFVLYCAVSIAWSDYSDVALKRWIRSLGDYTMILIVLTDQDRDCAVKRVLARVGFVLLPLSLLLIKYYPELGRTYATHWESTQFYVGVADNKNMLGMTCLVFGFAAAWRFFRELSGLRRKKVLLVHGTILALAFWLLNLSNSMTSTSCLVLATGLIAVIWFFKTAQKRAAIHFMVIAVVSICFSTLFLNVGGGMLNSIGRNSTLTGRTDIWDAVLSVPLNPMIGTGFESFWLGDRLRNLWTLPELLGINEAHNGYLEVYLNLGWVGLTLLAVLMLTGYRSILRLLDQDFDAGLLRLGFFVIAVIYNLTEAGIRTGDLVWIAFLLAIFAYPQTAHQEIPEVEGAATPTLLEAQGVV